MNEGVYGLPSPKVPPLWSGAGLFVDNLHYQYKFSGSFTTTSTTDTLYVSPFWVARDVVLQKVGVNIATGAGSAVIRIGVYSDSGFGYPYMLVRELGTVDASTSGDKSISSLALRLTPGLYWVGAVIQGAAASLRLNTFDRNPYGGYWMCGRSTMDIVYHAYGFPTTASVAASLPRIAATPDGVAVAAPPAVALVFTNVDRRP